MEMHSSKFKFNHMIQKNTNLFNFSKIKSEHIFRIEDCNSFNYNFSHHELNNTGYNKISIQNKKTIKNYIKHVDMNIPSNEKLKEEKFRSEFFNNYENSFANFCGINETIFSEIYEKNDFIPSLNQMGDIKVNINNIIKNINKFSASKKLRVRKMFRNHIKKRKAMNIEKSRPANKTKKIFEISKVKSNKFIII